ncbi:serine hydrolase [Elizabethkingia sp. JS20170427COW]|uniref:serine hydrolase domain-containing protein n=1 Tax=Elizabethkingia sp. JS20170427COW TaxID=2583851 RepID=UPI00111006D7|nr:serine hydrolase domain-containing protein [Elizabethkingia sp. JS20170427COW]QCX53259.1 beta-lactamase family protein [Elizabethkingia sp. JS20170427COW]
MKKFRVLCLLGLSLCFTACNKEPKSTDSDEEVYVSKLPNYGNVKLKKVFTNQDSKLENRAAIVSDIQAYYDKVWEKGNLSGGILVAKGNDILFEAYRGFGREGQTMPITKDVALHVASVSKPITAMAVMKLVEAGKVQLNQSLATIFPKFPYPEVTVEMLLKQRSGLPKYENFLHNTELAKQTFVTNQQILDYIIQHKPGLARNPDTGFMYCNTNYALLALVVEKVTQTPFPEAMQEMVFKPLKMKNTYIFQEKDILTASQSFLNMGKKLHPLDYLDLVYGDKNVYTTPRDLYNFSKALYSKDFLKPELMKLVFEPYSNEKPGVNNYGIGFRMKLFNNGTKLTYHNGWWHGSNSVFGHLLDSKVTIVAIGNAYSPRVYTALALLGLFENFPPEKEILTKVMRNQKLSISE